MGGAGSLLHDELTHEREAHDDAASVWCRSGSACYHRLDVRIRFGTFTLDLDARRLTEGARDVHLTPKALDLLVALVLERPKALSKSELQERLWADTFVVEANLSNLIAEVREALGDRARAPLLIRTAHGFFENSA